MTDQRNRARTAARTAPTGQGGMVTHTLLMIAFGVGALGYCIAIDRPGWFHIRPISGTAAAMANASSANRALTPAEVPAKASTPKVLDPAGMPGKE